MKPNNLFPELQAAKHLTGSHKVTHGRAKAPCHKVEAGSDHPEPSGFSGMQPALVNLSEKRPPLL
jgi:hypothetical protein